MKTEIIAEIGQNHNGDIAVAMELIKVAKQSGADAAKFQVYSARSLFPPKNENEWFDYNLSTELSRDDVFRLADYCEKIGIEFMASVFDLERLSWLETIEMKRYKIASRSIKDADLIAGILATGKPIIASLGMWGGYEFPAILPPERTDFLFCVSKYPTPLTDLSMLKVDFSRYSGFSDHTVGCSAACASFVLGARILEKHLTLDRGAYGPDHACSMTPTDLLIIDKFRKDWEELN